ncbi:MAG TPA: CapA family protein [Segeticoccus sp.]|nr:CapA family protein [Segeticoccus sp.]
MRRRRFRAALAAGAGVFALLLAGCSNSATGSAPTGSPDARPTGPASAAASPTGPSATAADPSSPGADQATGHVSSSPSRSGGDRSVTIAGAGDILLHYSVQEDAAREAPGHGYDFRPMFREVRPLLTRADVALCHQETPISTDTDDLTVPNTLVFNAPRQIAQGLAWAGFDGCDTAGNHVWDQGLDGMRETITSLRSAGLKQVGASKDARHSGRAAVYHVPGGPTVAQLAYTYTILNDGSPNTRLPADGPWMRHYLWPARGAEGILHDARAARRGGADLVVVSMHWGLEYHQEPTEDQRRLARKLLESGDVDLILGTHVHVVQPCQKINGRYVVYGMGNFLSNQAPSQASGLTPSNQDGVLVLATFEPRADGGWRTGLRYQPTYVQTKGHVVRLATPTHHGASFRRTVSAMNALGDGACDAQPRS